MTDAAESPRICSECEHILTKARRIENGSIYCDRCYARIFVRRPCTECGGSARVHRNDPSPICRKCRNARRRCVRCGKPVPRAGRLVAGQAVCPACSPMFKIVEECPVCGRMSRFLSFAPEKGFPERVCERCRGVRERATCSRCRKHRRIAGRDQSGRPLCPYCAKPVPESHQCPDCGVSLPGGGKSRCLRCANVRKVESRARLDAETMRQPWAKDLFLSLCRWPGLRVESQSIVRRIDAYSDFFAAIDRQVDDVSDLNFARLLDLFGEEGLRRNRVPVTFLSETLGLWCSEADIEEATEGRRIRLVREGAVGEPWAKELGGYEDYLRRDDCRRRLAERTVWIYLRTARNVLVESGKESMLNLADQDLNRVLRKSPGSAASLMPFVRYLRERFGLLLETPKPRKRSRNVGDREMLEDMRRAITVLKETTNLHEARAHLAIFLSRLMGVSLKGVLRVRKHDIELESDRVLVRSKSDEDQTMISGEAFMLMKPWLERLMEGEGESGRERKQGDAYLFAGQAANRALDVGSVGYWKATR